MSHKVSSWEVIVAGGGVIGAACARALARRGLRVALCEPGPAADLGAASPASAGMLAAQVEPGDETLRALAVAGRQRYAALAPTLRERTGIDIGLLQPPPGIAVLALDADTEGTLREAAERQRREGLRCEWLGAADLAARFPGAAPCRGALFAPDDGAVDPPALTRALLADAARNGATLVPAAVGAITRRGGVVTGVETATGPLTANHVVIAAGAWSPRIGGLPRPLPVEPVRGQLVAVPWPAGIPPVILYGDHAYVLPRGTEAILGSTMERVGFDPRVSDAGIAAIRTAAERLFPALALTRPPPTRYRAWAGLRPVTPDGKPILGPDPDVRGLWYATGHGRNGILLAALTGEITGRLIGGEALPPAVDITPFRIDRFVKD